MNAEMGFLGDCSAQTVCPPPKLRYKRRIPGMSTRPWNNSHYPKLCHLSCTPRTNSPWNYPLLMVFGAWKTPCAEVWKFFTSVCMHAPVPSSRLSFQKQSKAVQDKWPKGCIVLVTKTFCCCLAEPLRRFLPIFLCECTLWPPLIFRFHPDPFRFGEVKTVKPLRNPQSVAFEVYNKDDTVWLHDKSKWLQNNMCLHQA